MLFSHWVFIKGLFIEHILLSNSFGSQYILRHSLFFKIGLSLGQISQKDCLNNVIIKNNKK